MYCMLWFNFIPGLSFLFFSFKLIFIHDHTQKQKKIKFKPRIKLNHNVYIWLYSMDLAVNIFIKKNNLKEREIWH